MNHEARDYFLAQGARRLLAARPEVIQFTEHREADRLLNDLRDYPHAFLLACLVNRQMKAKKAWMIPYEVSQRLGSFAFDRLRALTEDDWYRLLTEPTNLHRFSKDMAGYLHSAVQIVGARYNGDASQIWSDEPTSACWSIDCFSVPAWGRRSRR